jgi:HEAT repeat protein
MPTRVAGLSAEDPEERRQAVAGLGALPPVARVASLLQALGDSDWRVRKEAIGLSAQLGPEPELLSALVSVFEPGDNVGLRNAAVEALGAFGRPAVAALAARMGSLDADGKKLSIEALGRTGEGEALEVLEPLLRDPDLNVRVAALEAVGAIGVTRVADARGLLLAGLGAAHQLEILAAAEALVIIGAAVPFETVQPWLGDALLGPVALTLAAQSGDVRAARPLLEALLAERDDGAVSALAEYVSGSEAARRAALSELPRHDGRAERLLLSLLCERHSDAESPGAALIVVGGLGLASAADLAVSWLADPQCYAEADQALFLLGAGAVPALLHGATSGDDDTQSACLDLLGRLPPEAVGVDVQRVLTAALSSPSAEVQRAAVGALMRVGAADCIPELVRLLREAALVSLLEPALVAIGQRYPERALGFLQLGSSEGAEAHAAALVITALGRRGRLGDLNRDELTAFAVRLLNSTSHAERRAALAALSELGSVEALEPVSFALTDEEQAVRLEAVRSLGRLKSAEAAAVGVPALLEVVAEARDPALVLAALRALGESSDARALGVLAPLVRASDARVAVTAVEALSRHGDHHRLSSLFDALNHSEPEVVKAAMLALATEAEPRVAVHLGACLDRPAWDVRRLAADLLGRSPDASSASLLRARLAVEVDPMVREALARALESSGPRRSRAPRRQGEL